MTLTPEAEAEWARLRRQIELIGDTDEFWLAFVLVPSAEVARVLRERTEAMLAARGRRMRVISPASPDELRRDVLPVLFDEETAGAGNVWVEATAQDVTGKVQSPWGDAWGWLAMRMNERRDALRRRLKGGLVLVARTELKETLRDVASDLWSVRSLVLEVPEEVAPEWTAPEAPGAPELIAESPAMKRVLDFALRAAGTTLPVLLVGEAGTGKNLLARFIHQHSVRRNGPMVAVHLGGLSGDLGVAELVGFKRGAFTGASVDREGAFREAHQGTLFLDELDHAPPQIQPVLFNLLDLGVVVPIGSEKAVQVDVRVIAATLGDSDADVAEGRISAALYDRLRPIRIEIPPLRERPEDIPALATHFLREAAARHAIPAKRISPDALTVLATYAWPGNVRELANRIEAALLMAEGDEITARGFGLVASNLLWGRWKGGLKARLSEAEAKLLREALRDAGGNREKAARLLGLPLRTLTRKLKTHGLHGSASPRTGNPPSRTRPRKTGNG